MTDLDGQGITRDYFYKRKVIVYQQKKGYRFSIDAPLLADFLPWCRGEAALEVGTGCGVIALLALYEDKFSLVHGLEIQESLSQLAVLNGKENGWVERFRVIRGDFNEIYPEFQGIRHIFSNPPFNPVKYGRVSPNPVIRDAKTETCLSLWELMRKSYATLGQEGNLYMVLPYARMEEVLRNSKKIGFHIGRLRQIFSFAHGKPGRFLVQLTNYGVSNLEIEPLIMFKEKGGYTEEMDRILAGTSETGNEIQTGNESDEHRSKE